MLAIASYPLCIRVLSCPIRLTFARTRRDDDAWLKVLTTHIRLQSQNFLFYLLIFKITIFIEFINIKNKT